MRLKPAFIRSPACHTAQQAHGRRIPLARPEMPQHALRDLGISALTASHTLALFSKEAVYQAANR